METNELTSSPQGAASAIPPATGTSKVNVGTAERIASVIGGTALGIYAVKNWNTTTGKLLAVAGVLLLKRGATGFCEVNSAIGRNSATGRSGAIEATAAFTVNKPRKEVYAYWRDFSNLPSFMKHLDKVEVEDEKRSIWTARIPGGISTISWEAEIVQEELNQRISWRSLPGSTLDNAGEVSFMDAGVNGGTLIQVRLSYRLPAGDVGSAAGKLFNPVVEKMIQNDLRNFKNHLENPAPQETASFSQSSTAAGAFDAPGAR